MTPPVESLLAFFAPAAGTPAKAAAKQPADPNNLFTPLLAALAAVVDEAPAAAAPATGPQLPAAAPEPVDGANVAPTPPVAPVEAGHDPDRPPPSAGLPELPLVQQEEQEQQEHPEHPVHPEHPAHPAHPALHALPVATQIPVTTAPDSAAPVPVPVQVVAPQTPEPPRPASSPQSHPEPQSAPTSPIPATHPPAVDAAAPAARRVPSTPGSPPLPAPAAPPVSVPAPTIHQEHQERQQQTPPSTAAVSETASAVPDTAPPAPPVPPAPAVERIAKPEQLTRLPEQVAAVIRVAVNGNASSARIVLSPPELGHVQVRLDYGETGVSATVTAAHPDAVQALTQSSGELRRALEDSGVTVARLDVARSDAQPHQQHDAPQRHVPDSPQRPTNRPLADAAGEPEEITIEVSRLPLAQGRVDILA